jgi:thiol-disulfide isomerase/thioredoxin
MAPDLDNRPGEPVRSTLASWLQTCPKCQAVAPDLTKLEQKVGAVVASAAYLALTGEGSAETLPFRRWAKICERAGDRMEHAEALLQAAWAADDIAAEAEAAALRIRVARLWGEARDWDLALRRLDVLRRAGQFEMATHWAGTLGGRDAGDTDGAILAFQTRRIALRDAGRHLISAALPPPAHRPHVAHNPAPRGGFWSRLFGQGRE